MRWLTNFYDFKFKWTATAAIGIHPDCHSWWISKIQAGQEDTLEEWYAIKFCFKLGKNATETFGILQTAFEPSCLNRASVFEWHKRFKEGRESVRDDERCGRSKRGGTPELIVPRKNFMDKDHRVSIKITSGQTVNSEYYVMVVREFRKRFRQKRPELFKSGQQHFYQDNAPVHNSILITKYLTKMGIKTIPLPPCSVDLPPCDFW